MFTYIIDLIVLGWLVLVPITLLLPLLIRKRSVRIMVALCYGVAAILVASEPRLIIPIKGATHNDWNPRTFWYEPWGKSI